jgi:hypothetical protein
MKRPSISEIFLKILLPARCILLRSKNLSVAEKIAQISQENCDDPEVKLEAFPSVLFRITVEAAESR